MIGDKIMARFTLELYCWGHKELEEYLLSLKGVKGVKIENEKNVVVDIDYDSSMTDYRILKMEIRYFLDALRIPSVLAFDKHNSNTKEYTLSIENLCCDFCFMGMMEELLDTNGIEKAKSDYDIHSSINSDDIHIVISYDEGVITEEEIKKLEDKFNYR